MINSLKKIVLLICMTGALILGINAQAVAHPVFSRVLVFGDSLSDIGNNQDGLSDQAPETNKMPTDNGQYRNGDVWVVYLINYLKEHGYLVNNTKSGILQPSRLFDEDVSVDPAESLDVAYSGDPSGGLTSANGKPYVYLYHNPYGTNDSCYDLSKQPTPPGINAICGVRARAYSFIHNPLTQTYLLDKADPTVLPNTLAIIWVGANDVQQQLGMEMYIEIMSAHLDADKLARDGKGVVISTVAKIMNTIERLKGQGVKYFLVLNLPNLGYTPKGYLLNALYYSKSGQPDAVTTAFTSLTNGFNQHLRETLNNISGVTIYQPDFSLLFNAIHDGKTRAFSQYTNHVNQNPVFSWQELCCANHTDTQTFDASTCQISTDDSAPFHKAELASMFCRSSDANATIKDPKMKNGIGYFAFYNDIHPTTCANAYIARYAGRTVLGETTTEDTVASWDPADKDTMLGCAEL